MQKINLHTHTTFCDGKATPEQMILCAIEKKLSVLGFSGHSMFPFAGKWHIAPREHEAYVQEIRELAKKYESQIKILCGFEADYFPGLTCPDKDFYSELSPDYLIGSVHYVVNEKGHYSVDASAQRVQRGLDILYNGDGKKAVQEYFAAQREMLTLGKFEILGHPDVIRKRNGILHFFDENESWYIEELKLLAKSAKKADVIVEINTGAIARGAMDDFYPSEAFLQILCENKVPVCINSDAHSPEHLDCAFERAVQTAKKIGYKELVYPVIGSVKIEN